MQCPLPAHFRRSGQPRLHAQRKSANCPTYTTLPRDPSPAILITQTEGKGEPMQKLLTFVLVGTVIMLGIATAGIMTATKRAKAGAFDMTGKVACAQEVGQVMDTCAAAVARASDSAAAVVVTFPNGFARTLIFDDGVFVRGNPTMSGVGTDMEWHLSDSMYFVRVDDQRFELPEALVFGE